MRNISGLLVIIAVFLFSEMTAKAAPPEVFANLSFREAKAKSVETNKFFIVDSTASWCAPCKQMDKTTWIDEDVVAWIEEHAIAIQLDVDEKKVAAKMLKISAMPTVIVFKAGKEFDRVVGFQDASQLIEWLDGVKEGKRAIEKLREQAGDRMDPDGNVDIQARYQLANTLMRRGELDEATEEFVWLWENMLTYEESYYGVRLSFMAGDMTDLAKAHEPAKKAFKNLRDQLLERIDKGSDEREVLIDWLNLNEIIADSEATLAWYDQIKDSPKKSKALSYVENDIFELLIEKERWSDAGWVFENPVAQARQYYQYMDLGDLSEMPEDQRKMFRESIDRNYRNDLSMLYSACLASERDKSAGKIVSLLLEKMNDEVSRFSLIKAALKAEQPREIHLRWLDEAADMGENNAPLRRKLKRALAKKAEK